MHWSVSNAGSKITSFPFIAFYAKGLTTPITRAAWRDKPTYGIMATEDKSMAPEIQHNMYKRSNTKVSEVKGSHVIFMSQPEAVGDVINCCKRSARY